VKGSLPRERAARTGRTGDMGVSSIVPVAPERGRFAGVSTRRSSDLMTRGVRADRVGVAPAPGRPEGQTREGTVATAQAERRKRRTRPWREPLRTVRPLARETSAGGRLHRRTGLRPRTAVRWWSCSCSVRGRRGRGFGRAHDTTLGGDGAEGLRLCRAPAEAGERRRRSARAHAGGAPASEARIGRSSGGARGSSWLQKSTSGARSRPEGHGSSPSAPRSGGRARGANRRRKPGRGGESRQHASSDTGGGLLVIPRAGAKACCAIGGGSTRRWKASWCGADLRL
jgi:hypothetical protein